MAHNGWILTLRTYDLTAETIALCEEVATFVVDRLPLARDTAATAHIYGGAPPPSATHTGSYKTTVDGVPTVFVDLSGGDEHLITLIAHELFHVYQGCTTDELTWVHEGSATVFQNMVHGSFGAPDPFAYLLRDDRLASVSAYDADTYRAYEDFNAVSGGFSDPNYAMSAYMCMCLMALEGASALFEIRAEVNESTTKLSSSASATAD